ncbi:MAG: transcriptional regulator PpsR [Hylemonella sp.]|uniref:transcriptional regulator PpsR n=1 Tax=Hylemonella sp. TaxID=2066020 RepID=UPI0022C7A411|nr:transcriptional regulator PpsR [Hylemonella sp.]MCZ8253823.1 transcriptional regulator PpsR [Hylemonella sp.]
MRLPTLDSSNFTRLLGVVSDLALVMDASGVIEDVSTGSATLVASGCQAWIGRRWLETVTSESRTKIQELLASVNAPETPRWRQVNHPSPMGNDVAVQYVVLPLEQGKILALGRDLEAIAELQRRLVETQQSMERDYLRLRQIEARYRVLFDTSSEAVLLVDAATQRVLEANMGAQSLLKDAGKRLVGRDVREWFEDDSQSEVQSLLRTALATGRIEMCAARVVGLSAPLTMSATVFRQEGGAQFLIRLVSREAAAEVHHDNGTTLALVDAMEHFPDGWLLTDTAGVIKTVNEESMALMGLTAASQIVGQGMERWLQRGAVDWGVLNTSLRQQLPVRNFATEMRTLSGLTVPVEVSAVYLSRPEPAYAFFVRDVNRRPSGAAAGAPGPVHPFAELSQLVGRRPIKDIVGETVDTIERMCIVSALELTHNNRASAAEMLGLSRQSLYVKLRRFGIVADADVETS